MKIVRIVLYSVPIKIGMSLTRYVADQIIDPQLTTVIVRIDTDDGLSGWGESCSAPSYYLPELSSGTRDGIIHVAPLVLGHDPRQIRVLYQRVQQALRGHGNARTALDMALWDICGKAAERPLVDLWGGRVSNDAPVFAVLPIGNCNETSESLFKYREIGYSRFQVKVGAGTIKDDISTIREIMALAQPEERFWFDPNRAWLVNDAIRVIAATKDLSPTIENPCETYEECKIVAERTGAALMLDESIDTSRRFIQAVQDGVMDIASLKLNTLGGLSKVRFLCDLGVELGVPMRIENYGGTGILLAAVTHLAQTLPERNIFGLYDYVTADLPLVTNPLKIVAGRVAIPPDAAPGLGVEIDESLLGASVASLTL
jgi:cis-L-3-hydroxyproline dehydratase